MTERFDPPERRNMPVELMREEVYVEQHVVPDRPEVDLGPGAFQEGTICVPVRGEEVVVRKRAVLAGEVVVRKQRTTLSVER
jgi:uncharacterized protein (TIGR02271 family)